MSLARDYIELIELWENTDKNFMAENIKRITGYPIRRNADDLAKITNVSNHTVLAWFNRSRSNVKIPLIKLCILADYFNVDVRKILSPKNKK